MPYTAPYMLPPGQPTLPEGEFLLPVCTNRERLTDMLNAFSAYRNLAEDKNDFDFMIDVLRALAFIDKPEESDCVPCGKKEKTCIEYAPNSHIIEWAPNDPYNTPPNTSVPGYANPPWYVVESSVPGGIEAGDIVCDFINTIGTDPFAILEFIIGLPDLILNSGLPRFRVNLQGAGTLELHLLQVIQGGVCLVWYDDDIATAELINLQSLSIGSLASITAILLVILGGIAGTVEIGAEYIHEVEIKTPGAHHVDVVLIPNVTLELTDFGFGGGLRKIVVCGFDEMYTPCPDPEPCPECPDPDDIIDDIIEEIIGGDIEDLEMWLDCHRHAVGDIKMSASESPGIAWIRCDGSFYPKTEYPALYTAIGDVFGVTEETFAVPDLRGRAPVGVGAGVDLTPRTLGEQLGTESHTLTESEIPEHNHVADGHNHTIDPSNHSHVVPSHGHTSPAHTHTSPAHTHTNTAHDHGTQPHNHDATAVLHDHTVPVRENAAAFGAGQIATSSGVATSTRTSSAVSIDPAIQNATVDVNPASVVIDSAVVTVNSAAATINDAGTLTTDEVLLNVDVAGVFINPIGGGESHNNMQPSLAVNFYIFAGCQEGDC